VSEHFDNAWDTELTPELEAALAPTPEPAALTATTDYKVLFGTTAAKHDAILFNMPPTLALLLGVLELERFDLDDRNHGETDDERKVYVRSCKRIDNWIALLRLAGEPKLPRGGEVSCEKVEVAGIEIGFINVYERKAWTLE